MVEVCVMINEEKKQSLLEVLSGLREAWQEASKNYKQECDHYWDSLSYEQKLMAFYSVCERIHKGDVEDGGSYRYVLYDVFEFDPDAYSIGMECGYMDIHNLIIEGKEKMND